jgi:NAD(P)H dehydrogenase (quinone)
MYMVGLPFTESALSTTTSGGSPYGATHVAGMADKASPHKLSADEQLLAQALGKRVAELAAKLRS